MSGKKFRSISTGKKTETSTNWISSVVDSLTPSVLSNLWSRHDNAETEHLADDAANRTPSTARYDSRLTTKRISSQPNEILDRSFEEEAEPDEEETAGPSTSTPTHIISDGTPYDYNKLDEMVSRHGRQSSIRYQQSSLTKPPSHISREMTITTSQQSHYGTRKRKVDEEEKTGDYLEDEEAGPHQPQSPQKPKRPRPLFSQSHTPSPFSFSTKTQDGPYEWGKT